MPEARLQQIIARAGVASRRRAEVLISEGRVQVNGVVVQKLGTRADPEKDTISVDGETLGPAQAQSTVILHKPVQVVTTLEDPRGRETVADLVSDEPYRFVPVGRLDYQTEGLLFLTTDGDLVHRLLHPSHHVPKTYHVKVKGRPRPPALDALRNGIQLDDGTTRPALIEVLEAGDKFTWLEIVVTEGRNRLVRRMVDAVGHAALRVVRTEMATLELGKLRPGQFRYLDAEELAAIYATAGLPVPKLSARASDLGSTLLGKARRGRGPRPGVQTVASSWRPSEGSGRLAARGKGSDKRRSGHGSPQPGDAHRKGAEPRARPNEGRSGSRSAGARSRARNGPTGGRSDARGRADGRSRGRGRSRSRGRSSPRRT